MNSEGHYTLSSARFGLATSGPESNEFQRRAQLCLIQLCLRPPGGASPVDGRLLSGGGVARRPVRSRVWRGFEVLDTPGGRTDSSP